MKITIPGKPIAKKRPRFARRGKFVTTYNDQQTEEGRFLFDVQQQIKTEPLSGPILLKAWFGMPIPKGTSKKRTAAMKSGEIKHTKKPDVDNLLKFVKDCLNGVAWNDDSQVFNVLCSKSYTDQPRTELEITEWEGGK